MSFILDLKVIPKSKDNKFVVDLDKVTIYLKSLPERNKANIELIKVLSKSLNIPQYNIQIISGFSIRNKRVQIIDKNLTLALALEKLKSF